MQSPVGELHITAGDKGLVSVLWARENIIEQETPDHPLLSETEKQLNEYFAKQRKVFDLPLDFIGTDFQLKVWEALLTIPFGETRSYGQIAKQISISGSVRAVGGAANKNPIVIIAPCHRVIGATGKLTGFGGGLENKAILLGLENSKTLTLF